MLGFKIYPATQRATQAGGNGLNIVGEIHVTLFRDKLKIRLDALVAEKLHNTDVLGGMNFIWDNDVIPKARQQAIEILKHTFPQTNLLSIAQTMSVQIAHPLLTNVVQRPQPRYASAFQVHVDSTQTLLPGQSFKTVLPSHLPQNGHYIIEPRHSMTSDIPLPVLAEVKDGLLSIPNNSEHPVLLNKSKEFAQVRPVSSVPYQPVEPAELLSLHKILKRLRILKNISS